MLTHELDVLLCAIIPLLSLLILRNRSRLVWEAHYPHPLRELSLPNHFFSRAWASLLSITSADTLLPVKYPSTAYGPPSSGESPAELTAALDYSISRSLVSGALLSGFILSSTVGVCSGLFLSSAPFPFGVVVQQDVMCMSVLLWGVLCLGLVVAFLFSGSLRYLYQALGMAGALLLNFCGLFVCVVSSWVATVTDARVLAAATFAGTPSASTASRFAWLPLLLPVLLTLTPLVIAAYLCVHLLHVHAMLTTTPAESRAIPTLHGNVRANIALTMTVRAELAASPADGFVSRLLSKAAHARAAIRVGLCTEILYLWIFFCERALGLAPEKAVTQVVFMPAFIRALLGTVHTAIHFGWFAGTGLHASATFSRVSLYVYAWIALAFALMSSFHFYNFSFPAHLLDAAADDAGRPLPQFLSSFPLLTTWARILLFLLRDRTVVIVSAALSALLGITRLISGVLAWRVARALEELESESTRARTGADVRGGAVAFASFFAASETDEGAVDCGVSAASAEADAGTQCAPHSPLFAATVVDLSRHWEPIPASWELDAASLEQARLSDSILECFEAPEPSAAAAAAMAALLRDKRVNPDMLAPHAHAHPHAPAAPWEGGHAASPPNYDSDEDDCDGGADSVRAALTLDAALTVFDSCRVFFSQKASERCILRFVRVLVIVLSALCVFECLASAFFIPTVNGVCAAACFLVVIGATWIVVHGQVLARSRIYLRTLFATHYVSALTFALHAGSQLFAIAASNTLKALGLAGASAAATGAADADAGGGIGVWFFGSFSARFLMAGLLLARFLVSVALTWCLGHLLFETSDSSAMLAPHEPTTAAAAAAEAAAAAVAATATTTATEAQTSGAAPEQSGVVITPANVLATHFVSPFLFPPPLPPSSLTALRLSRSGSGSSSGSGSDSPACDTRPGSASPSSGSDARSGSGACLGSGSCSEAAPTPRRLVRFGSADVRTFDRDSPVRQASLGDAGVTSGDRCEASTVCASKPSATAAHTAADATGTVLVAAAAVAGAIAAAGPAAAPVERRRAARTRACTPPPPGASAPAPDATEAAAVSMAAVAAKNAGRLLAIACVCLGSALSWQDGEDGADPAGLATAHAARGFDQLTPANMIAMSFFSVFAPMYYIVVVNPQRRLVRSLSVLAAATALVLVCGIVGSVYRVFTTFQVRASSTLWHISLHNSHISQTPLASPKLAAYAASLAVSVVPSLLRSVSRGGRLAPAVYDVAWEEADIVAALMPFDFRHGLADAAPVSLPPAAATAAGSLAAGAGASWTAYNATAAVLPASAAPPQPFLYPFLHRSTCMQTPVHVLMLHSALWGGVFLALVGSLVYGALALSRLAEALRALSAKRLQLQTEELRRLDALHADALVQHSQIPVST